MAAVRAGEGGFENGRWHWDGSGSGRADAVGAMTRRTAHTRLTPLTPCCRDGSSPAGHPDRPQTSPHPAQGHRHRRARQIPRLLLRDLPLDGLPRQDSAHRGVPGATRRTRRLPAHRTLVEHPHEKVYHGMAHFLADNETLTGLEITQTIFFPSFKKPRLPPHRAQPRPVRLPLRAGGVRVSGSDD